MYRAELSQPAAKRFQGDPTVPIRESKLANDYFADFWHQLYRLARSAQAIPSLLTFAILSGIAPRLARDLGVFFFTPGIGRSFTRLVVTVAFGKYLLRYHPIAVPTTKR